MKKLAKAVISLLVIIAAAYLAVVSYLHFSYPNTKWDWSKIDTNNVQFSKDFIWGTATAAHQIEGDNENTNWGEWEEKSRNIKHPIIKNGDVSGKAVDGWNRYKEDIKLMKDLGVNSYRFSLAWNKIEPEQGKINEEALKHYDEVINELKANGIEPMITLHHFTHPLWFEKLGAFEKEENIKYFVDFSKLVFNRFENRVRYWVTLNEPNVFITNGYFDTIFPPGKHDTKLAAKVLENMLKAHVEIYKAFKGQRTSDDQQVKVGLATSLFQFEPARRWNLGDWAIARISSNVFNESILGFFRTGKMNFYVPFEINATYENVDAPNSLDFIGINYYSHFAYKFDFDFKKATKSLPVEGEEMTDMPYTIYTEGIYRAIEEAAKLKKPIIITENGISDAKDDRREKYIRQSLYAVSKAIKDGYDVRGYYYWTLMDNFEWAEGYTQKFGLYEVNMQTQERTLRNGSKAFTEIINKTK